MTEQVSGYTFSILFFAILFLTGIISLVLAYASYSRKHVRGAKAYAGLCLSIGIYAFFYGLEVISPNFQIAIIWNNLQYLGIAAIPGWIILFVMQFFGYNRVFAGNRAIIPWIVPVITILLKFTDPFHGLIYKEVTIADHEHLLLLDITPGIGYYTAQVYLNILLLISLSLSIKAMILSGNSLFRKQLLLLLAGMFFPWTAYLIYLLSANLKGFDIVLLGFAIASIFWAYAIFKYQLFDILPVAKDHLFKSMRDGIVVIDNDNNIADINQAANNVFQKRTHQVIGIKADIFFANYKNVNSFLKSDKSDDLINIEKNGHEGVFIIKKSKLTDSTFIPLGTVITLSDITEQKMIQDALYSSELRYQTIFDHSPFGIFHCDSDGILTACNLKFVEIIGSSYEKIIGLNIFNIPDQKLVQLVSQTYKGKTTTYTDIYKSVTAEKETPVRAVFSPVYSPEKKITGIIGLVEDQTIQLEIEKTLKEKTKELENYFTNSSEMLCIMDSKGKFLHVNRSWEVILGYCDNDLENKSVYDFIHPSDHEKVTNSFAINSHNNNFICSFLSNDGQYLQLEWDINITREKIYASVRDVTTRLVEKQAIEALLLVSQDFLKPTSRNFDYNKICEHLLKLCNAQYVIFNLYSKKRDENTISSISIPEEASQSIEVDTDKFIGQKWRHTTKTSKIIAEEKIIICDMQDEEDSSNLDETSVIKEFSKNYPSDKIILAPILTGGSNLAGSFLFAMPKGVEFKESPIIELFTRQIGMLLARKEVEDLIYFEKAYFENLFESAPAGIVVLDSEDKVIKCNHEFTEMFGYSSQEVIGKTINSLIVPEDLKHEGAGITKAVSEGKTVKHETQRIRKNGTLINVSILGKPIILDKETNIVYGIYIDTTEQIKSQELLYKQRIQLKNSLDTQKLISDIAFELISTKKFIEKIKTTLELIGQKADLGRIYIFENNKGSNTATSTFTWNNKDVEKISETYFTLPYHSIQEFKERISQKGFLFTHNVASLNKKILNIIEPFGVRSIVVSALYVNSEFYGFIGFDECRYKRKWTNSELDLFRTAGLIIGSAYERRIMLKSLMEERDKAKKANLAKSDFLANMSHEIRTPMNAILGFSETLFEELENPDHKQMLKTVLSSGRSLLSLLNDILDLSKIESGKLTLHPHSFNLLNLIDEVLILFRDKAGKKKIKTYFESSENFPEEVLMDEIRIKQILFNLIGNAVKFTNEGYVKVKTGFKETGENTGEVTISIEDTGIGIPKEQLTIIFETFRQASSVKTKHYEGTGLGLSISRRLAEKMNGLITVESSVGKGSVFTVTFNNVKVNYKSKNDIVSHISNKVVFSKAKILVIDDLISNILLVQGILNSLGFNTKTAQSGKTGLQLIDSYKPDLIILDLRMPEMDGFTVVKIIKSNPNTKNIPVIAYTAAIMELNKNPEKAEFFDDFLYKPVNKTDVINVLSKFIKYKEDETSRKDKDSKTYLKIDTVNEIDKKALKELIEILKNDFVPKWKQIKGKLVLNKLEVFAKQLSKLAERYKFIFLQEYSSGLLLEIDHLNLDGIEERVNMFPDIINEMEYGLNNDQKK